MNATIEKDNGARQTAVLQQAGGGRHFKPPERHPGLTADAVAAHNAGVIKLGNSTITMTMPEGLSTETSTTTGKPFKVSVAQMLVYELRVRDAMTQPPVTAGPGDSLRTIQNLMKTHRISGVPILQNDTPVGLVSIEDIINALDQGHVNDPAERWMTRNIITLRDHFSLVRAVAEFDRHGFGRFPVVNSSGALVGVITRGDITACLMQKLEKRAEEAAAREAALFSGQTGDLERDKPMVLQTEVKSGDYESAGKISQRMRQILRARGVDPVIRRRAAIIAYEAEMNMVIHSIGGDLSVAISPGKVIIEAVDRGPGIENVDLAMQEGWSTAGPLARELGFGAGMGLPNIKKCSDQFEIHSEMSVGTRLHSEVLLNQTAPLPDLEEPNEN
ncbi:MAG: CBS domain-containing protein [Verrucomicrobiota bacterium]|jgi:CBS domain-containing protein/anti-sigma regulatory factor (Ser/Thr protein kinase)